MHIRQNGQLKQAKPRAATTNAVALTIVEVAIPTARFTDAAQLGELHRYVGHDVEITIRANPLPSDPDEPRPMERIWSANGQEHTRPGPTEHCSECNRVIGDDPDARFRTPIAGQPHRPLCGECAAELDDQDDAAQAAADEDERDRAADAAAVAEPGDLEPDEPGEAPLGDGPMPERPADEEPITTPTRRRR